MRKRIVTGACLMLLMGGMAYAADDQAACETKLSQAETLVDQRVEERLLSEDDVEEVNMLLDDADALCTEGKYADAIKTLANVDKIVAAAVANRPSPEGQEGQQGQQGQ